MRLCNRCGMPVDRKRRKGKAGPPQLCRACFAIPPMVRRMERCNLALAYCESVGVDPLIHYGVKLAQERAE